MQACVDVYVLGLAGTVGVDVMKTDPTAPIYIQRGWGEVVFIGGVSRPSGRCMC